MLRCTDSLLASVTGVMLMLKKEDAYAQVTGMTGASADGDEVASGFITVLPT